MPAFCVSGVSTAVTLHYPSEFGHRIDVQPILAVLGRVWHSLAADVFEASVVDKHSRRKLVSAVRSF
jgi:hypothetical protein